MTALSEHFGRQSLAFQDPLAPEGLFDPNIGWKIHLSVGRGTRNPHYSLIQDISGFCRENEIVYKVGRGRRGKDMTIYVGAWDDLIEVRDALLEDFPSIPAVRGMAAKTDVLLGSPKIAARFCPYGAIDDSDKFWRHTYGTRGLPHGLLREQLCEAFGAVRNTLVPFHAKEGSRSFVHERLCAEYGDFYYGDLSKPLFEQYLGLQAIVTDCSAAERLNLVRERYQPRDGEDYSFAQE